MRISSIGITTNSVTTYNVIVSIDAADGVKTGMTTSADISVQAKTNVVMIPIEAIQGSGNYQYVTVKTAGNSSDNSSNSSNSSNNSGNSSNGNSAGNGFQRSKNGGGGITSIASSGVTRKRIQIGLENENYAEVTSGLNEGDTVLVAIIKSSSTSSTKATNPLGGSSGYGGGSGGGYGGGNGGGRSGS